MRLSIDEIIAAAGAEVAQKGTLKEITAVSTDTRTIKNGDLFVAIKGPHFDGNEYVDEAIAKGAGAVVTSEKLKGKGQTGEVCVLVVDDTVKALGDIAHAWRKKVSAKIVAVTGSNGKSTTKEMIAQGISSIKRVVKTEGNFNNLIGLPLQVFRISEEDEVAVLEMGMNAAGEIRSLARIAEPDVGIITNVNPAHLEKLHTVENVAKAKGELFEEMNKDATIVVNMEDPWAVKLSKAFAGKKITFGMQNGCDVQFGRLISEGLDETSMTFYVQGREYSMSLPVPGVHNVMNALAAIAVGAALKVKTLMMIPELEKFSPMKMRMERVQLLNGVQLINDSYNANPSSMLAALRTVGSAKRAGRFIAVLGDMFELGRSAAEKHRELGNAAAELGVSRLFVTGSFARDVANGAFEKGMKKENVYIGDDIDSLKGELLKEVKTGDVVLVKGSRGMKMEQVVEHLKNEIGA